MSISTDPLTSLGFLHLEVSLLPFILSVWLDSWCLPSVIIIFYEIGMNINLI